MKLKFLPLLTAALIFNGASLLHSDDADQVSRQEIIIISENGQTRVIEILPEKEEAVLEVVREGAMRLDMNTVYNFQLNLLPEFGLVRPRLFITPFSMTKQYVVPPQDIVSETDVGVYVFGVPNARNLSLIGWGNSWFAEDYSNTNVYGVHTGLVGLTGDIGGLQAAVLANKAERVDGFQISPLGNIITLSANGMQVGLVNYAQKINGMQVGLTNWASAPLPLEEDFKQALIPRERENSVADKHTFFIQVSLFNLANAFMDTTKNDHAVQIGVINMSRGSGFQIGLVNYNEDAWIPCFPIINFAF